MGKMQQGLGQQSEHQVHQATDFNSLCNKLFCIAEDLNHNSLTKDGVAQDFFRCPEFVDLSQNASKNSGAAALLIYLYERLAGDSRFGKIADVVLEKLVDIYKGVKVGTSTPFYTHDNLNSLASSLSIPIVQQLTGTLNGRYSPSLDTISESRALLEAVLENIHRSLISPNNDKTVSVDNFDPVLPFINLLSSIVKNNHQFSWNTVNSAVELLIHLHLEIPDNTNKPFMLKSAAYSACTYYSEDPKPGLFLSKNMAVKLVDIATDKAVDPLQRSKALDLLVGYEDESQSQDIHVKLVEAMLKDTIEQRPLYAKAINGSKNLQALNKLVDALKPLLKAPDQQQRDLFLDIKNALKGTNVSSVGLMLIGLAQSMPTTNMYLIEGIFTGTTDPEISNELWQMLTDVSTQFKAGKLLTGVKNQEVLERLASTLEPINFGARVMDWIGGWFGQTSRDKIASVAVDMLVANPDYKDKMLEVLARVDPNSAVAWTISNGLRSLSSLPESAQKQIEAVLALKN